MRLEVSLSSSLRVNLFILEKMADLLYFRKNQLNRPFQYAN
jgi:hypothetical protein